MKPRPKGVRFTDQEHVNTATYRGASRPKEQAYRNCALCATAGAINLLQGRRLWSTGMVAGLLGRSDHREALGDDSVKQAHNIYNTVLAMSGAQCIGEWGSPAARNSISVSQMMEWMARFPPDTVFVVLCSGNPGHHWLNAKLESGGQLTFYDYQSDRTDFGVGNWDKSPGVKTSDAPFMGMTDSTYADDDNATAYAMAFSRSQGLHARNARDWGKAPG